MDEKAEAYLIDYIAVGVIGFAIGQVIASVGGFQSLFSGVAAASFTYIGSDWGRIAEADVIIGLFVSLPAGFLARAFVFNVRGHSEATFDTAQLIYLQSALGSVTASKRS